MLIKGENRISALYSRLAAAPDFLLNDEQARPLSRTYWSRALVNGAEAASKPN
jgi:hypothetical protein